MLSVLSLSLTINCDVFNVLEDALHCLLENWWSRCNSEWQPVVLEQSLVGVDDYQLLTGIIQGHLLVGVSQIQLDEQLSFCQECKQILNSGDRIRIELGHSVHLGLVVPADSVWWQKWLGAAYSANSIWSIIPAVSKRFSSCSIAQCSCEGQKAHCTSCKNVAMLGGQHVTWMWCPGHILVSGKRLPCALLGHLVVCPGPGYCRWSSTSFTLYNQSQPSKLNHY